MRVRTRFAPSPTGRLHLGNARTAIFNWLFARTRNGAFVLRVEDTDRERSRPEYERAILSELAWLGITWDEGPDSGGEFGPYRQSERAGLHARDRERLVETGAAYPCFCSEAQLEADRERDRGAGRMPRYSGRCRGIPPEEARERRRQGERAAIRFKVPAGPVVFEDEVRGRVEVDAEFISDFVLVRGDGTPTYNFAVVVDDIGMRITHVIRGEDHLSNTSRQVLLYAALGAAPPRFAHLPLVLGEDGSPLSKRHGDTSLEQFAREGFPPEAVFNYLALLGWSPAGGEVLTREELVAQFALERVARSPGVFDRAKLGWLAGQHLRRIEPAELVRRLRGHGGGLWARGLLPPDPSPEIDRWLAKVVDLVRDSVTHLGEVDRTPAVGILLEFDPRGIWSDPAASEILSDPSALAVIRTFAGLVAGHRPLSLAEYRDAAAETGRRTGTKGKALYHPIRIALTGRGSGPELARLVPLIEEAAALALPRPVPGCAERSQSVAREAGQDGGAR